MKILGISAFYHDSAATILVDGEIVAAAQEERFTRIKHDNSFPINAIEYCLREANLGPEDVDHYIFYDKPFIKFERLMDTYLTYAPRGLLSFLQAMPVWIKEKLFTKNLIRKKIKKHFNLKKGISILFSEHHLSHAASAFYPSPYEEAMVLCVDGVGEWATTTLWKGCGKSLDLKWEINFPHSLGLLYSAFTYYTGFKVNSGEYKLMGLAPYGEPKYVHLIYDHLIDVKEDGSFKLNMEYFNFAVGLTMTNSRFHSLFEGDPRKPETPISQKEMDLAASIQVVLEDTLLKTIKSIHDEHGGDNLCLAGGVALNCVANGKLLKHGPYKNLWIQPAAGDAGGSMGAALLAHHEYFDGKRVSRDSIKGSYLGPDYKDWEIEEFLKENQIPYLKLSDEKLFSEVSNFLSDEKVIGWFQGRMEFGPRSLGNRSILGDARSANMQKTMNLKIKYRESFRPFAPAVLVEDVSKYFDFKGESPYMLMVAKVADSIKREMTSEEKSLFGIDKLNIERSSLPAITHVDYSARLQTVNRETNPRFYSLISKFKEKTNSSVLVNTSFNVRGEPIVCTPNDAYTCFMRTEMDYLIMNNFVLKKEDQPSTDKFNKGSWEKEFALD